VTKAIATTLYAKRNPEKLQARRAVSRAIKRGKLIRPGICLRCAETKNIQGHHYKGYKKENWLDIIWLCPKCHHEEHELTCKCAKGKALREELSQV